MDKITIRPLGLVKLLRNVHICPIASLRGGTVFGRFGGKADINQRVGIVDSAGGDMPAAPVMVGAAGYSRPGLRRAPSGPWRPVTF